MQGRCYRRAAAAVSACTRCNDVSNSTSLTTYGSGRMSRTARATRPGTRSFGGDDSGAETRTCSPCSALNARQRLVLPPNNC